MTPPEPATAVAGVPEHWERRAHPPMLNRRFEFPAYKHTRRFLDALAALAEAEGMHPQSISFGTTYVNVALELRDVAGDATEDYALARRIEDLYGQAGVD